MFRLLGMERFAETAFYIGITPTAAAAPVIVGMLDGDIEFTTVAVCLSNIAIALLLPLLLGVVGGASVSMEVCLHSLASVAKVVLLSALLALILRCAWSGAKRMAMRCIGVTFYLWIGVLLLAAAKSSQYLHSSHQPLLTLSGLAGISIGLCVVCFALGRRIGQTGSPAGMQSGARAEEYDPHHLLFSAVCRPARDSGIDFLRVLAQYMERAPTAFPRHGETESGTGGFFPKIIPQCCLLRRCKVYWRNRRRFLL